MTHPKLSKLKTSRVEKGWGYELILVNNEEYCGKILHFNAGSKFSMHSHLQKRETFYCSFGELEVEGINTEDATRYFFALKAGEVLDIPRGAFHQITAKQESEVVEVSTTHWDEDSFRVCPGNSQIKNIHG